MDAVLNWVWQGAVIAVALFVILRLLEHARGNVRYTVCGLTLLIVISIPVLAWLLSTADVPQLSAPSITAPMVQIPVSRALSVDSRSGSLALFRGGLACACIW